jgi:hypothetical protein
VVIIELYVISAGAAPAVKQGESQYLLQFDKNYALRFLAHLKNTDKLCTACGEDCVKCRVKLVPDFSNRIAGHLQLPVLTNQFIDDPDDYLHGLLPVHDITIAINIHNDLLVEIPRLAAQAGSKALIVPVEHPDWLGRWTKEELEEACKTMGLEFAAPKPFCNLTADPDSYIGRFMNEFRIGRPILDLTVENGVIKKADVVQSAPCGATYYLARILESRKADETIIQVACKGLSSYPCTASTKIDSEFKDSITHAANYIMIDILNDRLGLSNTAANR